MSAVALDRQYRWWPNLQDSTSRLQPPTPLPPPTYSLNCPRQPMQSLTAALIISSHNPDSSSYLTLPSENHSTVSNHTNNPYYSSLPSLTSTRTHNHQHSKLQSRKGDHKNNNLSEQVKENPIPTPRMHAQATSGSLTVSTIEDIVAPRKLTSQVLSPEPSCSPRNITSNPVHSCGANTANNTTPVPCQVNNTTCTANPLANFNVTVNESSGSSDENQSSSSSWSTKTYNKCSSRGSVAGKNKGCTRRRLVDDEGFIRRAACVCLNEEETQTCHHSGLKKHRTAVYVFIVTEEHADFPEARLGRRRQWFSMEQALLHLARHRPLQSAYLQLLMMSKLKVAAAS
ncbi:uncharacterized protein [Panulirus ornatus]|uniref:uncharacterized protein isoform X2 n=1 Tax=Panulirus ornatus TaxID=150431 RepID=UPI003A8C0C9D